MRIVVIKSTELSERDWEEVVVCFNQSFALKKTIQELKKHYFSNTFGYSYHAIARNDEGKICGHTTIIPYLYYIKDTIYTLGLSGGTFVVKEYRNEAFLFLDMYIALKEYCRLEKLKAIIGVSNINSLKFAVKILEARLITDLSYYIFPLSYLKIQGRIKYLIFDKFFRIPLIFMLGINKLLSLIFSTKEKKSLIHLVINDDFYAKRFSDKYQKYRDKHSEGIYRIVDEQGTQIAYIMDFRTNGIRTYTALVSLVIHIVKTENVDAILFIGKLLLCQFLLIKVPKKFIPQRFPLTVDSLDSNDKELSRILYTADNWDFSLMNFDVR